jgi:hypothetical protein
LSVFAYGRSWTDSTGNYRIEAELKQNRLASQQVAMLQLQVQGQHHRKSRQGFMLSGPCSTYRLLFLQPAA